MAKLLSVQQIWDAAPHNAFTDLICFHDRLLCAFREGDAHVPGEDGTIRLLESDDGVNWRSIASLMHLGIDLRDPKLSIMPDGRLMLLVGGSVYRDGKYKGRKPHVAFSNDGVNWTLFHKVDLEGEWIWHLCWEKGVGYGFSYSFKDPGNFKKSWILKLFSTEDGLHYSRVKTFGMTGKPNETTGRFLADGRLVALVRREGGNQRGRIGWSRAPFDRWNWHETGERFGGQNFLVLPNGEMWAASRVFVEEEGELQVRVGLVEMDLKSYKPKLIFPSGGDCSYPGMAWYRNRLWISYYSSHEAGCNIYLAQVEL